MPLFDRELHFIERNDICETCSITFLFSSQNSQIKIVQPDIDSKNIAEKYCFGFFDFNISDINSRSAFIQNRSLMLIEFVIKQNQVCYNGKHHLHHCLFLYIDLVTILFSCDHCPLVQPLRLTAVLSLSFFMSVCSAYEWRDLDCEKGK